MTSKAEKQKNPGKYSSRRGKYDSRLFYAAGAAGLAALVACAFLLPRLIFGVRDSYLYRDTVLEARENTDMDLLGATYEPSLRNRLKNFGEGLAQGKTYYVSEQQMTVTQELTQQLMSGNGIFQAPSDLLIEGDLIADAIYNGLEVSQWKQYVIYSDDYAGGVNFIIWYLKLTLEETGESLELLMDAEDYTLYGIQASNIIEMTTKEYEQYFRYKFGLYSYIGLDAYQLYGWWREFCYYYQVMTAEEYDLYYSGMQIYINDNDTTTIINQETHQAAVEHMQELNDAWESAQAWDAPDENTFVLHLPYEDVSLDFSVRLLDRGVVEWPEHYDEYMVAYWYPELFLGIDSICELIPEFAETF